MPLLIYESLKIGQVVNSYDSDDNEVYQDTVEDLDALTKHLEETNIKEPEDKTIADVRRQLQDTAITAQGIIHVDQLYDKPLTKFDPELESEYKVRPIQAHDNVKIW